MSYVAERREEEKERRRADMVDAITFGTLPDLAERYLSKV